MRDPRSAWEARHGGLLGVKYLLAARPDAAGQLLPTALLAALRGLKASRVACRGELKGILHSMC